MAGYKPHFADNGKTFTIRNVNTGELQVMAKTPANKPLYDWAQENWGQPAAANQELPAQIDPLAVEQTGPLDLARPPEETLSGAVGDMAAPDIPAPMPGVAAAPGVLGAPQAQQGVQETLIGKDGYKLAGGAPDGAAAKSLPAHGDPNASIGRGEAQLLEKRVDSTRMSPGTVQAEGKYRAAEEKSIKAQIDADTQAAETNRIEAQMRGSIAEMHNMEIQAKQTEKENATHRILGELDEMMAEYRDAKVDPGKLFNDMSTSNRIMSGIGLLFGAIGSGAQGPEGQNGALNVLNKAIDRDLDAQKANINKMGDAMNMQRNLLGDTMKVLGDEVAAREAAKARQLEWAKDVIGEIRNSNPQPAIQAKAAMAEAALEKQIYASRSQVEKTVTSQQWGMPKKNPQEGVGDTTMEKLLGRVSAVKTLHEIETLSKDPEIKDQIGPIAGRILSVGNNWQALGPQETKLLSLVNQYVAGKIHEASGTGASEKERESFLRMLMNPKQRYDSFQALLNQQKDELETKIRLDVRAQAGQDRRPIDLKGLYEEAGIPWNGKSGSTIIGFTPMAAPTSKKK